MYNTFEVFCHIVSHQGLADPEALGFEEGEDHATPEENDVALLDQGLDHGNLRQQQQQQDVKAPTI